MIDNLLPELLIKHLLRDKFIYNHGQDRALLKGVHLVSSQKRVESIFKGHQHIT